MVKLLDPKWAILSYHISAGDKLGLSLMNAAHFTGITRAVFDIALEQAELSMPVMMQALTTSLDQDSLAFVISELGRNTIEAAEVDHYRRALVASYNNWRIKDAVDWASEQIAHGQSRMRVLEELYVRLSSVHDIRGIASFEEIFTQVAAMNMPTIPTGYPEFEAAGIGKWQMGNIALLAGDTGTFKTTTAVNLCRAALYADPGLHVFYFMKEQPYHEVWYKLFAMESDGFTYSEIQDKMNIKHPDATARIRASFSDEAVGLFSRFHVVGQDTFSTPQDVASMLRGFSVKHDKMMWVVDYITRLDFGGKPEHFNAYYAAGLEVLKNVTLHTQSFGIVITQLKEGWNIDSRTQRPLKVPPGRKDIIWSSEAKNLAAYVMMLYHPATYFDYPRKYLYLSFLKVRHIDRVSRIDCVVTGERQLVLPAGKADKAQMETIFSTMKKESYRGS